MSLRHAILGFLNVSPKTGYEIQKKVDFTIQHFWPTTQSQIYRTLKELQDEDLIQCEVHYQSEKPNKKMYSLSEKGITELLRWLNEPHPAAPHRNSFLVQLFFSKGIPSETIISNLSHYRQDLENRLHFLKSGDVQSRIELGQSPQENVLFQIIVENGISLLESEIGWVDSSILKLQQLENNNKDK